MLSLVEHEKSFITPGPGLWDFRQTLMLSYQDANKNTERTSDSLNEGLPIKMARENFHKK